MSTIAGQQITSVPGGRYQAVFRNKIAPPLWLLVIVIGFFWKLTLTSQFTWMESPDQANQVLPWQQVQAAAFHRGTFPLWDPYLWGGQSLIGQAQPGTAYPPNWILYSLPLNRDRQLRRSYLHWYWALIHAMAALFCYWLCRDMDRSRMASLIAGIAFALSGTVGTTDWPQIVNGMIWMPLVLMFLFRAVREERPILSAALSGFFLGVSWLSGHHQVPVYMTLAVAAVWIFHILRGGRLNRSVLLLAGVAAIFLLLTSALQVLPAYEYGHLARRWIGTPSPVGWKEAVPYSVHHDASLHLFALYGLIIPGVNGFANPYVGLIILAFAGLAVALWWKDARVRILCVLSLAGLFVSLGYQSLFHGVLYALMPLVDKSREPGMAVFLFNFGVAVLTAFGFDGLTSQTESAWPRRITRWLACIGALMLLLMLGVFVSKQLRWDFDDRPVLVAVLGLLLAALFYAYHHRNLSSTSLGICCLLLLLMDLGNSTGYGYANNADSGRAVYLKKLSENQDILKWIRSRPGRFRIQRDSQDIPFNYGDWYGIEELGGYVTSLPNNLCRLGWAAARDVQLYGVKYWIGRKPGAPDQIEVFTGQSGLKVYEMPGALPRVWSVHDVASVESENQIVPAFENPQLDLRHTALFWRETPKLDPCPGEDQVSLTSSDFNSVVIQADMRCRGMVVLSDNYYPGWDATVDGKPARIWEAYTVIRGVEVDAGAHRIEMRYQPASFRWGAGLLVISVLGLVGLWWNDRRRAAQTSRL